MRLLIHAMIFLGSALMVYNIARYGAFIIAAREMERGEVRKVGGLIMPLLLLIFFLVGYLAVGISGIADLMMASILFGGSVFVFLLLLIMFRIIGRLEDADRLLAGRYEDVRAELAVVTKDSLAAFLVNLTQDEVEERSGDALYDTDLLSDRYSELFASRQQYLVDRGRDGAEPGIFTRERLLQLFEEGHDRASEVLLVRRSNGEASFVRLEAALRRNPVSGDVTAFLTERPCNEDVVRETLTERVLMDRYDRIAYIIEGKYRVLVSSDGKAVGQRMPSELEDSYESIYLNHILPALSRSWSRSTGQPNPLRLSVIDRALEQADVYEVDAPFETGGEIRRKHFVFYRISDKAKIYLMLLSDAADVRGSGAAPQPGPEPEPAPEPAPLPGPEPEDAPEPEASAGGRALRVLLADDNEINRELGELMLSAEGWEVTLAANGREAVDKVAASKPGDFELVLMDLQMPVLDGFGAAGEIRALPDPALAAIPIVALTAEADEEAARAVRAAGMNGCAAKPLDVAALKKLIGGILPPQEN